MPDVTSKEPYRAKPLLMSNNHMVRHYNDKQIVSYATLNTTLVELKSTKLEIAEHINRYIVNRSYILRRNIPGNFQSVPHAKPA